MLNRPRSSLLPDHGSVILFSGCFFDKRGRKLRIRKRIQTRGKVIKKLRWDGQGEKSGNEKKPNIEKTEMGGMEEAGEEKWGRGRGLKGKALEHRLHYSH
ncbi:unnamed protein product [Onchocerca flexuosa]|uniref:Uncharacterized protein n=1 Tax=Onchocerca flexuosa TaxID=387005 RepID=A0A183I5Q0_9BILA|nr:unnamed protein product [Onchocerca flexuosa]